MTQGKFEFLSLQGCIALSVPPRLSTQGRFCGSGCKSPSLCRCWSWVPRACVTLTHLIPLSPYQEYPIWTDTNPPTLRITSVSLYRLASLYLLLKANNSKVITNKKTSVCFSKQSKLVSPSVFLVFQDKLFVFPSHLSRSVRLPVINQNLTMDLAL